MRALEARRMVRSLAYWGLRYHCPICGWSFRRLKSFGFEQRENACCPRCGSLERHRLLWLFLNQRLALGNKGGLKLLHVAPEEALLRKLSLMPNVEYVSLDLSSPLAKVHADLCDLPFGDATFDAVLCNHVLEHVLDDDRAMREIRRVLKPSGWAVLQTPIDPQRAETFEDASVTSPEDRARVFGQFDHVRIYGRDYVDRLRNSGFKVEIDEFCSELSAAERARFALPDREDIHWCRP
jgi:SAM-dependent methyltransferase